MPYYIYENWLHDRARLHRGECSHCNNGAGTQTSDSTRNGKWHPPFTDAEAARQALKRLGRADSKSCGHCKP